MMKTGLPIYFHLSSFDKVLVAGLSFLNINAVLIFENDRAL
jgi:hypothetical protein